MSLVRGIAGRPVQLEQRKQPDDHWLKDAFMGATVQTGKLVTVETALAFDAVTACVRLLSETCGAFPLKVYETVDGRRREADGHNTFQLLHDRPNWEHPPVTFWGLVMTHLVTWGDSFIGKTFDANTGLVVALWPVRPDLVRVERKGGQKVYWVRQERGVAEERHDARTMIHIQGFTLDGLRGLSAIALAREAIGAGLAQDEFGNRFWSKGALPSAVLEKDGELTDGARRRLERWAARKFGGLRRMHEIPVLEEGVTLKPYSFPLKDLEFVALHASSARKVARIFRVPASLIDANDGDSSLTYRTVEGDSLHLLTHSLRPWLKRMAQTVMLDPDLFPVGRRRRLIAEHVVDELLLMDTLTKAKVRQISGGNRAWRDPSEFRDEDNLDPIEGLDERAAQAQPSPAADDDEPDEPEPERDRARERRLQREIDELDRRNRALERELEVERERGLSERR